MSKKGRDFEEVVRQIARSENDVDKVLKAAKLQRTERCGFWGEADFTWVLFGAVALIFMLGMVAVMVLTVLFD